MSNMSRKEILDLRAKMQTEIEKLEKAQGYSVPLMTGFQEIDRLIANGEGQPPTLLLRNLGRLMKHYTEELRSKPGATIRFNVAVASVLRGEDVQMSIRAAKRAVKDSVKTMEVDGILDAKTHTHLRADRYNKTVATAMDE